ncbi:pre-peptidase C-terminal domain-containing protein, partial [Desulforhopalus vacuolatus]|uniref:pre-peptidase C-terminal domain-containing protein n=1 Tax=Desulforhopalus vacuolatus TaxID=40414 RepID=UPI001964F7EA
MVSLDSNGDASITGYAGDNDYYTFVAQNSGTATISLTGLSSNIDLYLSESPDENSANPIGLLAASYMSGSSSESVSYNLTSGETYYVNVDPDGTSTSDYNLSINTVAAVTPVPSTNNDIING